MEIKKMFILFWITLPITLHAQSEELQLKADSLFEAYRSNVKDNAVTHPEVLHEFFGRQVSSYLASSGNLALSRGYAVLDNSDGRLFIGGTFTNRSNKAEKLSVILQFGMKSDIEENFSTLFSGDGIQNDIGLGGKFTLIGKGTLSLFVSARNNQKTRLAAFREYLTKKLQTEFQAEIENYKAGLSAANPEVKSKDKELMTEFYNRNIKAYQSKLFEQEANYLVKDKVYAWAHTHWLSIDVYLPLTKSEYKFAPTIASAALSTKVFRPHTYNLIYTNLLLNPSVGDIYFSLTGGAFMNNVVKTKEVKSYEYTQSLQQGGGVDTVLLAQLAQNNVFVGEYKEFWSFRGGAELVLFFPGKFNWLGISGSVERVFGDFQATHWKLGVPLTLQNEKGEPKVNFELQWREQYQDHSVGISIGVPFGGMIY